MVLFSESCPGREDVQEEVPAECGITNRGIDRAELERTSERARR